MTQIIKISRDYFDYMAQHFPVMCLSDEFYFFPRADKAKRFLNILDSLDAQKIEAALSRVKNLKSLLEKLDSKNLNLENQIDLTLLKQSMSAFLREFGEVKIWRRDPSLYLKILLLGIDHILTRFSVLKENVSDILLSRVNQIPRLLNEARENLREILPERREVAIEVIEASIGYFRSACLPSKRKTMEALDDFKKFLKRDAGHEIFVTDRGILERILKDSFSYKRSLEEIFDITSFEYQKTIMELEHIAESIDPQKTWQELLSTYRIKIKNTKGLLNLYAGQIEKIKKFVKEKGVITIPKTQKILVRPTPKFLQPLRASASYSVPLTDDKRERAYFYITAYFAKTRDIPNEYIFVTAHETYPGHHLLDSIRKRMDNPVRRQIESPLFYEGWASYAERLIDELGYIKDPIKRLVGLKRNAWRAVRAMLDVGIRINKLQFEEAARFFLGLGYKPEAVKLMLRHYALTPGYQLCYTIGKFEFDNLRKRFSSKLGLKRFHDFVLEGGQIPFDLLEKRLKNKLCRKNS